MNLYHVKQGCLLSPTLFNLFINGLIEEIKKLSLGVKCGELFLALLMFADDIALVAETEEDLQCMLNALHSWCGLHYNTILQSHWSLPHSGNRPRKFDLVHQTVFLGRGVAWERD